MFFQTCGLKRGHLRVPFCFCVKTRLHAKPFPLQVHFHANQTHFHTKGFARGLVLKQRLKKTRKWPGDKRLEGNENEWDCMGISHSLFVKSLMVYERTSYQNSIVFPLLMLAFRVIILFGSHQRQSKPIYLTGTTFLITVPSDRGNKTLVSCRMCCLNLI